MSLQGRNHILNLALTFCVVAIGLSACKKYDEDIAILQQRIDDLENRVSQNEANYVALRAAFEASKKILSITETDEKYVIVFDDNSILEVPKSSVSQVPYIASNGNWWVSGIDTGVKATGDNGEDGATPFIGTNGNWWVGPDDTGILAQGLEGDTPFIGTNGNWWIGSNDTGVSAQGSSGETPFIGGNGNWWIGSLDTGIKASGADAPTIVDIRQNGGLIEFEFDNGEIISMPFEIANLEVPIWGKKFEIGSANFVSLFGSESIFYVSGNSGARKLRLIDNRGNLIWEVSTDDFKQAPTASVLLRSFWVASDRIYFIQQERVDPNFRYYVRYVDRLGNVSVANELSGTTILGPKSLVVYNNDLYMINNNSVARFDASGNHVWSTAQTALEELYWSLAVTPQGEIIAGGDYLETNQRNGYIGKLDLSGSLVVDYKSVTDGSVTYVQLAYNGSVYGILGSAGVKGSIKINSDLTVGQVIGNLSNVRVYGHTVSDNFIYIITDSFTNQTSSLVHAFDKNSQGNAVFVKEFKDSGIYYISLFDPTHPIICGSQKDNQTSRTFVALTDQFINY